MSLFSVGVLIWAQVCGTGFLQPALAPVPPSPQRRPLSQGACQPPLYTIPVVFHVIHSGGADSLSLAVIEAQMRRLFEDFRALPQTLGYTPLGADLQVSFELATKDPQGNPTTGVVYWRYDQPPLNWTSPNFCINDEWALKNATGWPRDKYLNVWVVPAICGFSGDCNDCQGIAGYAYYPDIWDPILYGSVVGASFIGDQLTGRGGRTLVHELGHNLALAHPFEGGCGTADCENSGDLVCDTPPTAQENFSVKRQNTCTTDSPDRPDDPTNFMDYVSDGSMTHFTAGQQARVWAFLEDPGSLDYPLHQPAAIEAAGVGPYGRVRCYFWSESRRILPSTSITLLSAFQGAPSLVVWDFGGGQSPNPSDFCPIVRFSAAGSYSITLIAENAAGARDTFTRAAYIQVEDSLWPLPYSVDFEADLSAYGLTLDNPDGRRTWERWKGLQTLPGGAYGRSQYSMRFPGFSYGFYGERDQLITPALDFRLDSGQVPYLSFTYWYRPLDWGNSVSSPVLYTDTFRIWASPDGGGRWVLIYEKGGLALCTHPDGPHVVRGLLPSQVALPDTTYWRRDTLRLDSLGGLGGVRFRFEAQTGWGNNFYLDDIGMWAATPPPDTTQTLPYLHSPILTGYLAGHSLYIQSERPTLAKLELYNTLGQLLEARTFYLEERSSSLEMPQTLPAGLYQVRLITEAKTLIWPWAKFE